MPEFIPEHTPSGLDAFTRGYLMAVEWLLQTADEFPDCGEEKGRADIEGFAPSAIAKAKKDCAEFQTANVADLYEYQELSRRDDESAGHDYYLSRCGHGAGFFDRGDGDVFDRLQDAASDDGNVDHYIGDDGLIYEMGAEDFTG